MDRNDAATTAMVEFARQQAILDEKLKMYSTQLGVYALILENEQLKKHNRRLKEELEEARACEDPVLRAHRNIRKMFNPRELTSIQADWERRNGIPLDELEVEDE